MITCKKLLVAGIIFLGASAHAQVKKAADTKMNQFVTSLMSKMTLDEKLGQLNLPGAGDITTGQASSSDIAKKIRDGKVGGLFNIKGVDCL